MSEHVEQSQQTPQAEAREVEGTGRQYLRFTRSYIFEHWVQALSFITLSITGLPQRFSETAIAKGMIAMLGGIETVRVIHRVAAVVLMLITVYHIGAVFYRLYVLRYQASMLPGLADVKNAFQALKYNLGLSKTHPQQGRYTFEEKAEYWALVWGSLVMIITGFMLWNPIATTNLLPGQWIPAARAAHGGEALLAVLAIILWHFYGVLVKHFNRSMFTGHLSEKEMVEEHPLELADIKAGIARRIPPKEVVKKRQRVFFPVYALIALVLLVGIYFFVTYEDTAIAWVPEIESAEVFAPLTPTPLPTPLPTAAQSLVEFEGPLSWSGGVGALFEAKCSSCHGAGNQLAGLNLSSYAAALTGGNTGPAVIPGEAETSLVYLRQSSGRHPGQFSEEELALVVAWIEAGAPELGEGEEVQAQVTPTPAEPEPPTWDSPIRIMLGNRCSACHNSSTSNGGLDITTYATARLGGNSGRGFVAGDPEASLIYQIQVPGDHPGQLRPEELELLFKWIQSGAPQQ